MVPDSSVPPSQRQRSRSEPSLARALPIVFVALALAVLPTLAAASPPDPAWIGGIYDAADGDEIVTLIGDQAGSLGVVGTRFASLSRSRKHFTRWARAPRKASPGNGCLGDHRPAPALALPLLHFYVPVLVSPPSEHT